MKRKILGHDSKLGSQSLSESFSIITPKASSLTQHEIQQRLRKKRSLSYMQTLQQLDAGSHASDKNALNKLIDQVNAELPDIANLLLGIVAKCYLGHPYEVHTLQIMGSIIHHYKTGESLPPALEKARSLAMHSSYEYIEVYSDYIVTVSKNGSTSLITVEGDKTDG